MKTAVEIILGLIIFLILMFAWLIREIQNIDWWTGEKRQNHMPKNWLIWSLEHAAWWKPAHKGYTEIRAEAGRYTFEEAAQITASANLLNQDVPNEAILPE